MPQPDTSASPPAKPIVRTYPTPDLRDRIYVESRDARLPDYELPEKGSAYDGRDAVRYEGWVFATAQPSDKVGWTDHFYLNERLNQDEYSYSREYPWVDKHYPRYTRTYVFLRSDFKHPVAHEQDPKDCRCVLVDWKQERLLPDQVLDSLFVGITKVFERVPAPTKVVLDRPESVLPFNMRVAVPAIVETTVEENATDGESPEIIEEEDWHVEETTNTAFRKTVDRTKRVIPGGSKTLDRGYKWTPDQQLAHVTQTWKIGPQTITPRATLVSASIDDIGNNTTMLEEAEVPEVFPASEFRVSIPDDVPPEFRSLLPTRSTAFSFAGQAAPPVLAPGEFERISVQEKELIARNTVVGRDLDQLPKTLIDKELGGVQTHGSEHGGILDIVRTLDRVPMVPEEGFGILQSRVKNLGSGLVTRETTKLSTLQGASLLLTNPGRNFVCDPAVVFNAGTVGGGATAEATISAIPPGSGAGDPGGTFNLVFSSVGDDQGVFNFLGARYNGGVWHNPYTAGVIGIGVVSNQPVDAGQLAALVDREPSTTNVYMASGGGHLIAVDLGIGRSLVVNRFTLRSPSTLQGHAQTVRVEGTNDLVNFTNLTGDVVLPATPIDTWISVPVTDLTAWRYFRIFRTDTHATNAVLSLGEIEAYGALTIVPAVDCRYVYDGDDQGVFFFLGQRGGNGTWRNPTANGDIVVTSNGTLAGDINGLTDRQPSDIGLGSSIPTGFSFDLKAGRTLVCTKLSFRQRTRFSSANTTFDLRGRNNLSDPDDWHLLAHIHQNDSPDTWTSVDIHTSVPYRQFQILSPEPYFQTGEVELYGHLVLGPPAASTGGVTGITVLNGGLNFITAPEVRIVGGGGTGATAVATVVNGVITQVEVTNPGQDYTNVPDVRFFVVGGGMGAAATANLNAGAVDSIDVDTGGGDYKEAPLIQIVGDGTGATAHATVAATGEVIAVIVDTPGIGYTVASVLFTSAGGPVGEAIVGYGVASMTITQGGSVYPSPPPVQVGGDGFGVQAQAVLGFKVDTIVMVDRGQNYTSLPTLSIAGDGTGLAGTPIRGFAVASANVSGATFYLNPPAVGISGGGAFGQGLQIEALVGRPLLAIAVGLQGLNYSSNPGVVIGGDGTGATAHSVRSFALDTITVDAGGSTYTTATVEIEPPTGANGRQATAHAVIGAGAITSIVIDDPGFGYLSAPGITVNGDGTGAAAHSDLETSGVVDSVVIDTVGANFSVPPPVSLSGGGGSGAVISSTINTTVSGVLVGLRVLNGGSGYTSPPTLTIIGASATAVLSTSGQIVAVTVTNPGDNYTIPPAIGFVGGGGSGASALGLLKTTGRVKTISVPNHGEGFTSIPPVTIGPPSTGGVQAAATAMLQSTGKIKTLTLIDPGPEYTIAPLVSFFGCSGIEATALYLLPTGWPVLTDIITDPVEAIIINVVKKIVPTGTVRPSTGYVDIYALDKYRSIQITSSIDVNTLPGPDIFQQTHQLSLPPLLVSVGAAYSRDQSRAIRINTGFGSASMKSSVRGKIVVTVKDGYKGAATANVVRTFSFGPPPPLSPSQSPLVITPSSGTAFITTRHSAKTMSRGTTGGFVYVELSEDQSEAQDTLDISGVLTGALALNTNSGAQVVDGVEMMGQGLSYAAALGIADPYNIGVAVAHTPVSAQADLTLVLPVSCPRFLNPGTTFLLSAGVEKWRFGVYVQTLIYVTIPTPCPSGTGGYS